MAEVSKLKINSSTYDLKDATARDRIKNLESIGRFLSVLDASNGTVSSQPSSVVGSSYNYKVGDYYRIGAAGSYEPKPTDTFTVDSSSGSTNFQQGTGTYGIGDVIYCSNVDTEAHTSTWVKQGSSGGGTVQDVQVNGTTILSGGIANLTGTNAPAIDADKITSGTLPDERIASASTWNAKQDAITFNTAYDPSTNKAATMADIQAAIGDAIAASY